MNSPPAAHSVAQEADAWRFLQVAARLMLRYDFRTHLIKCRLALAALRLGVDARVFVNYREISIFGSEGRQFHEQVHEFRINVAVSIEVNRVLECLDTGRLPLAEAISALETVEARTPSHNRWLLALIFGLAASALAWLLRADFAAAAVSGVAAALGILIRQELAKRHLVLFALPFAAALIGALLGGIVIRLGWTETPGFCLMVPAAMLVPGPHLINGVYDVVENHMQTGLCRLGLASGILMAAALGVFLGGWITLGMTTVAAHPSAAVPMMPGVLIYQGIAGAMDIAGVGADADLPVVAGTLAYLFKAGFVIGSMALGLLAGARLSGLFRRRRS